MAHGEMKMVENKKICWGLFEKSLIDFLFQINNDLLIKTIQTDYNKFLGLM